VQPGVRSFRGTLAGGNDDTNLQAASVADHQVVIVLATKSKPQPKKP
jgi:hypothetical protein